MTEADILVAAPAAQTPGGDLFSKFDPLIAERQALLDTGVRDPFAIVMDEVHSPVLATINGKRTILLGTYNYMGMTFDPDVIAAGKKALDEYGAGTTGSRVLNGTYQGHKEVEEALKEFLRHLVGDGLLDRIPGQSGVDVHHCRQGGLYHPRCRQPRVHL
jgi:hypothetical protein